MFTPFERMMAFRYLRARKAEGFVSVVAGLSFTGIMLGVATLIIVMAVMNGFRQELITRILGLNGHLNIYTSSSPLVAYEDLAQRIRTVDGVTSVTPMIEDQVLMTVNGHANGAMVRAFKPEDFSKKPIISSSIKKGSLKDFNSDNVAIGYKLAERFSLEPGDKITLLAPKGKAGPFGTIPRSKRYTVGLIFDVGMYEYNSGFIFMPLEAAQKFFQLPLNTVSMLEVFTNNPDQIDGVKKRISMEIEGEAGVYDWRNANNSFFNALDVERNVMFLILTMIIIVAAFNIISSMYMLVKGKRRDIAIMRTMGASRKSMMKIFMLTGASIGIAGTLVGAILGICFALNIETIRHWIEGLTGWNLFDAEIRFLSEIPAEIDWHEVIAVLIIAIALSILATIYPAWRAARLDPVEALRNE